MSKRAKTYEVNISEKIRTIPGYAEHFIRAAIMDHDSTLQEALANAIDQYGHAELAAKLDKKSNNITRMVKSLKENGDIKLSTLKEILGVFGFRGKDADSLMLDLC